MLLFIKNKISVKDIFKIISWYALITLFATSMSAQAQNSEEKPNINIGLFYPISSNGIDAAEYTNIFSFNAIMGLSEEEKAFAMAGISNIIKENARGLQFAGVHNYTGEETNGLQFAGLLNQAGSVQGAQFTSGVNIAKGNTRGVQFAALANRSKDVEGFQIAGLLNIAENVNGVQFGGLMNFADHSNFPIGLVNIIKNGRQSLGLSIDETLTSVASFRSGGTFTYGILGVGYNLKENDDTFLALEGGLGGHLFSSGRFSTDAELTAMTLENFDPGTFFRSRFQLLPKVELTPRLSIFAGPSLNYARTDFEAGNDLIPAALWRNHDMGKTQQIYLGFNSGLQLSF